MAKPMLSKACYRILSEHVTQWTELGMGDTFKQNNY